MAADPAIPPPLDDDDDDVAWALQTAAVQWNRGARGDAVVWLRRAVDAAIACGNAQRTKDLTRLAAVVADSLVAEAMAQPDSAAPPPPQPKADSAKSNLDGPAQNPRHSLTGEIPFEVDTGGEPEPSDDDFDDEAPTIPPPADLSLVRPPGTHSSGEYSSVDADDLMPESAPGSIEHLRSLSDSSSLQLPFAEPTMHSHEPVEVPPSDAGDLAVPPSETPTVERDPGPLYSAEGDVDSGAGVAPKFDLFGGVTSTPEPAAEGVAPVPVEPAPLAASVPNVKPAEAAVEGPPTVDGVALDGVRGFEDLPEEAQSKLASTAVIAELAIEEEVLSFAAALVTSGRVGIMPAIADVAAGFAQRGDVVFTRGTLDEGVLLRVVALHAGTRVASWSEEALGAALSDCPWVADELRRVADRFQALAGSVLGPLGERLDDSLRGLVMPKLDVKAYGSGEVIVEQGKTIPGLHVVGAGRVELVENDAVTDELSPGDFLFAAEVLGGGKAHATARAGRAGALLLVASRSVAHELLVSVPPLLEILAG